MRRLVLSPMLALLAATAFAQQSAPPAALDADTQKDKTYALEQVKAGHPLEALDLLEKLHAKLPKDCEITMGLADAQLRKGLTFTSDDDIAKQRAKARETYKQAVTDGCPGDFARQMVSAIPEDGKTPPYSENSEVDLMVKKGEAAFARGDLDEAKDWYIRAVVLDPKNFHAALYAGDAYFSKKDYVSACEWFKRAAEIDPERESAHRYWGDALMARHLYAEARKHYIEAVIIDPYGDFVSNGLNNYLRGTGLRATWYKIQPKADVSQKDDQHININLSVGDSKGDDPSGAAWMAYGLSRAAYREKDFAKDHPNEKAYRHSLQEEAKALRMAAEVASSSGKHKQPLPDDVAALVKLRDAGFLEPYVLLNVPDPGITQDYLEYRKQHRDVLEHYLSDFVLPPPPADDKTE